MRNVLGRTLILLLLASIAGFLLYVFLKNFHPFCGVGTSTTDWNKIFAEKEYSEVKDLGKSFLTLITGVFVASITFSEKIVNVNTASSWSKSFLYLCWLLLLLSIILTGCGLAFLAGSFNQALYTPCDDNVNLFYFSSICFLASGIGFGLGLISMLFAGIISFDKKTGN